MHEGDLGRQVSLEGIPEIAGPTAEIINHLQSQHCFGWRVPGKAVFGYKKKQESKKAHEKNQDRHVSGAVVIVGGRSHGGPADSREQQNKKGKRNSQNTEEHCVQDVGKGPLHREAAVTGAAHAVAVEPLA